MCMDEDWMRSDYVNQQLQNSSIRKALVDHGPNRREEKCLYVYDEMLG